MRRIQQILLEELKKIPVQDLYHIIIAIREGQYQFENKALSKLSPDELALNLEHLMIKSNPLKYDPEPFKPYYIYNQRTYNSYVGLFMVNLYHINYNDLKKDYKIAFAYEKLKIKAKLSNIMFKLIPQRIMLLILIIYFSLSYNPNSDVKIKESKSETTYLPMQTEEQIKTTSNQLQIYRYISKFLKSELALMDGNPDLDIQLFNEFLEKAMQQVEISSNDEIIEESNKEEITEEIIEETKTITKEEAIEIEETNDIMAYDILNEKYLNDELTMLAKNHEIRSVTYMYYTDITNPKAAQHHLLQAMDIMTYHELGFIQIGDYYAVALGSKFGPIGSRFIIIDDNDNEIKIIKAEEKADIHTINGFAHANDHSIIEFLINPKNELIKELFNQGGPARINSHCREIYSGRISQVFNVTDDGLIKLIEERNTEYTLDNQSLRLTNNNY